MIQVLGLDKAQLDCESVDVHAGLERLSRTGSCQIEIVTITVGQRCGLSIVALCVKENGARLGRIKLKNFQIPRGLLAVDLLSG